MNAADRTPPQITPNIQETAQKLFSEISQLIDAAKQRAAIDLIRNAELVHKPEDPIRHHLEQLRQEQQISTDLLLKDPYILDFLDISRYLEKDLEDAILRDSVSAILRKTYHVTSNSS
jgi:predicted nuclease of restriction endonuclease-like (RecB) superfamily